MFPARALALYHFAPMTPMAAGAGIVLAMFAIFKAATQGLGFSQCTQQWVAYVRPPERGWFARLLLKTPGLKADRLGNAGCYRSTIRPYCPLDNLILRSLTLRCPTTLTLPLYVCLPERGWCNLQGCYSRLKDSRLND